MRVKRPTYYPSFISLESSLELENLAQEDNASQDPNEIVSTEIFQMLKPGNERVCVLLRCDGLTYETIGEIMGLKETQVKNIVYTIRKRVLDKFDNKRI